jgi:hypothetical protein
MAKIFLVLVTALLVSCASTSTVNDELVGYLGKSIKDVSEELGRPTNVYNMQDGTWHYLWTTKSKLTKGGNTSFMGVPLSKSTQYECTRVLIVDKRKIVVGYDIEGKC